MRFRSRKLVVAILAVVGVILLAVPASAVERSNAEFVIIPEGDVISDDLYAAAVRVIVDGTLDGDLFAFAAERVVINGTVTGSVTAVAPSVVVNGAVEGPVRVSGSRLEVSGTVGEDVVAGVVTGEFSPDSDVSGDVVVWAWTMSALGSIGQDLSGTQHRLELAGAVGEDVDVSVDRLEVVDDLSVGGDLDYRSANIADGIAMATVDGAIVAKKPVPPNIRIRAVELLGRLMIVLFLSIAALTTAYGWPDRTTRAVAEVGRRPFRRWLMGAPIVFAPFLGTALAVVVARLAPTTAALPLLLVMAPLILALLGGSFAFALIGGTPVVGWLGGVLFKRLDLYGAIVAGSMVTGLFWYLPWLGWLVPVVVLPLGLGSWMAAARQDNALLALC